MRVCCTRPRQPSEAPHWNDVPDALIKADYQDQSIKQKLNDWRCQTCGMPLLLDDTRYVVLGQIGQGGFGRTFRALDRRLFLQERVVKQLRSEQFLTDLQMNQALQSFGNEAQGLAQLNHPQIPRLFPPFTLSDGQPNQPSLFYLPQNYVDGLNVQEMLEQRYPQKFEEREIIVLLQQMLNILRYVHKQQLIHRDIKPSNIVCANGDYHLIDFGAVKFQQDIGKTEGIDLSMTATRICTAGYSPQEQYGGRAYPSSDLYSLAATCVCLLTARHPNDLDIPNDLESWRAIAKVTQSLAAILNKMLALRIPDRYQSAQEVIDTMNMIEMINSQSDETSQPPKLSSVSQSFEQETLPPLDTNLNSQKTQVQVTPLRWLKPGLALAGAIAALLAIAQIPLIQCKLFNSCPPEQISPQSPSGAEQPRFSKGDRLLFENVKSPEKMAGVRAIAEQNYPAAVDALTRSLIQNKNDPETLIYLNNARLWAEKRQTYKIGVSVPIGTRENIAQEILRGVAQAQDEINKSGIVKGIGLEIEIADDRNEPAIARQVAEKFATDQSILAVVGHNTSEVAREAANIYQAKGLVMIAPTMFDAGVAKIGSYIFRAVPTPETMSNRLADYIKTKVSQPKVLICYDSSAPDQSVFRAAFVDALTSRGGQKIVLIDGQGQDQCDYASKFFDPNIAIQKAIAQGANAIFVGSNVNQFQPTINLIKANNQQLSLFGSPTLYTQEVVKQSQQAIEGLVLVTPWSPDVYPKFARQANDLWGAPVNWRTATSYDATRAAILGLEKSNTRDGLRNVLQDPDFLTTGSGDLVRFLESRDRILQPLLVEVKNGRFEAISK
jgi:branched-chain amino acid transport system substrate-binding protein